MAFNMRHLVSKVPFAGSQAISGNEKTDEQHPQNIDLEGKQAGDVTADTESQYGPSVEETPSEDAQEGVQQVEAVTLVWTKQALIFAYLCIFLVFFINSLQQQTSNSLTPYVISDFELHSLIPVTGIISNIMAGVIKLPVAKVLDLWGRSEGFAIMTALCTLGLILMAVCDNVETYAAAQVFYWIGVDGMQYVLDVVIADTSSLKNRSIAFAFSTSPYIATTFAGPAAAQSFLRNSTWRWAFGTYSIVIPVVALPIFSVLLLNQRKAKKLGVLQKERSGRTAFQSIWHYAVEFDALGVFLIVAGLVLFLLPFSLAGYQTDQWRSAKIIVMLVIGVVVLIAFALHERFLARKPFIPFHLLVDRSVLGANLLSGTLFIAFYCWDGYFTSYLQVVNGLSVSDAGYVANTYSIGSCFWAFVVAYFIRLTGRFKWLAWIGMVLQILGGGLMIHFRQPDTPIGFVVMCQIFIAFGGGTLVICEQMAAMAAVSHGEIAAILAILGMFASIGGAIGSSVSGAIWTNTLPGELMKRLPADAIDDFATIYGDLTTQLSYPKGTPVRDAVIGAYGVAQQRMCIAGTAILVLGFVWIAMWKDYKVSEMRQVKGRVF
ncbi:MFS general substrate transporter [Rhizodiscina lignyota]|uniref:MFS general substrate transporter n=1 Tax=Rhizodiscina lignyota TaxID=1504668 RepID=A0A9P4IKT4_9PEZI|nr:MFS general substrate transporter [Rhizodiscina lignyota]